MIKTVPLPLFCGYVQRHFVRLVQTTCLLSIDMPYIIPQTFDSTCLATISPASQLLAFFPVVLIQTA